MIIHNAWRLDFNLSVLSFEENIRGSRNLVDLALSGTKSKFVFTSSIGTLKRAAAEPSALKVPEEPISDPQISLASGYTASKYVVEKVCF